MNIAVWDTYVTKKDGTRMHFDILVPDTLKEPEQIYDYGKRYLRSKGLPDLALEAEHCRFCHIEQLKPEWTLDLEQQGYVIFEMENCNE